MITSYGIILFDPFHDGLRVLLYKRRDTYDYVSLMRGSWSVDKHIINLLHGMTQEERDRIAHYDIDQLWDDVWVDHTLRIYRTGKAKKKYRLHEEHIKKLARAIRAEDCDPTMEMWEFPKGKREGTETNVQCALREFAEETRMDTSKLRILGDIPIGVRFLGTDHRHYENFYYIAETTEPLEIPELLLYPGRIRSTTHSGEASLVRWVPVDAARAMIPLNLQPVLAKSIEMYYRHAKTLTSGA